MPVLEEINNKVHHLYLHYNTAKTKWFQFEFLLVLEIQIAPVFRMNDHMQINIRKFCRKIAEFISDWNYIFQIM